MLTDNFTDPYNHADLRLAGIDVKFNSLAVEVLNLTLNSRIFVELCRAREDPCTINVIAGFGPLTLYVIKYYDNTIPFAFDTFK
jgi:hypothetical protein